MVSLTDDELGELLVHALHGWAAFAPRITNDKGNHAPLRVAIGLMEKWGDRPLPAVPEKIQEQVEQALRPSLLPGSEEYALLERFAGLLFKSGQAWETKRGPALLVRAVLEGNGPVTRALLHSHKTPDGLAHRCVFKVEASYASRFPWLRRGADGTVAKRGALLSLPGLVLLSMAASWKNHFVSTLGMSLLQKADWQAEGTSNGHRLLALVGTKEAAIAAWAAFDQWRHSPTACADVASAVSRLHPFGVVPWIASVPTDRVIPLELFDAMAVSIVKVCGSAVRVNEQEACLKGLKNLFACQAQWPDGRAVTLDNWRSPDGVPLLPLLAKELLDPSLGFREVPAAVPEQAPIGYQKVLELLECSPPDAIDGRLVEGSPASVWLTAWQMGSHCSGQPFSFAGSDTDHAWGLLNKHPLLSHAASNAVRQWLPKGSDFPDMPLAAACLLAVRMLDQPHSTLVAGLKSPSSRLVNAWVQALTDDTLEGQRWAAIAWTALLVPERVSECWPSLPLEEKKQASAWLTENASVVSSLCSKGSGAAAVKALALSLTLAPTASNPTQSAPRL